MPSLLALAVSTTIVGSGAICLNMSLTDLQEAGSAFLT